MLKSLDALLAFGVALQSVYTASLEQLEGEIGLGLLLRTSCAPPAEKSSAFIGTNTVRPFPAVDNISCERYFSMIWKVRVSHWCGISLLYVQMLSP